MRGRINRGATVRYVEIRSHGRLPFIRRAGRWMDWEPRAFYRPTAAVPPMTCPSSTTVRLRRGTWCPASTRNGLVARFHCFSSVGFVGADAADAGFLRCRLGAGRCMRECACAFELAEDGFLVSE